MHEGEKLPSKRQLSQYLSVSQTTVENAYAQLVVGL
nr:GntR family transcriptional regulator [Staphylococcus pseudintermedius]